MSTLRKGDFWLGAGAGAGIVFAISTVTALLIWDAGQVTLRYTNTGDTSLTNLVIEGHQLGLLLPQQSAETTFPIGDGYHAISYTENGKQIDGGIHQNGGTGMFYLRSNGGGYRCPKPLEQLIPNH